MPQIAKRGEVWIVDLGMVAKTRPALVLSVRFSDAERAVYAVVPHTTAVRGGRFEVSVDLPWLKDGAFDIQGLRNIPSSVLVRRLGLLNSLQLKAIEQAARAWLSLGQ